MNKLNTVKKLNITDLQKEIPSAFQPRPAQHLSNEYIYIDTLTAVKELQSQGWYATEASEKKKNSATSNTQWHFIRFRNDAFNASYKEVGDSIPEIVLINSHNGQRAFRLHAGIFRMVCSNGMIVADKEFAKTKQVHRGGKAKTIQEMIKSTIVAVTKTISKIKKLQNIELDKTTQRKLAKEALDIRFKNHIYTPNIDSALKARRSEDEGNSAWLVLNRLQEAILRGGFELRQKHNVKVAKPLTSAPKQVTYNKNLWELFEEKVLVA
jgi:hypothetical protein